jgi:hypothetical protein
MNDLRSMFLGAAFVALGVLVAALAERIRGSAGNRRRDLESHGTGHARGLAGPAKVSTSAALPARTDADLALDRDAIAMLAQSGYAKKEAAKAVAACSGSERATLESLVRASLKRLLAADRTAA